MTELNRVETGVIQFENDWPGVFIRGDNALAFVGALATLLEHTSRSTDGRVKSANRHVQNLFKLLTSCHAQEGFPPQQINREKPKK
jgi:hypothetical protein